MAITLKKFLIAIADKYKNGASLKMQLYGGDRIARIKRFYNDCTIS